MEGQIPGLCRDERRYRYTLASVLPLASIPVWDAISHANNSGWVSLSYQRAISVGLRPLDTESNVDNGRLAPVVFDDPEQINEEPLQLYQRCSGRNS